MLDMANLSRGIEELQVEKSSNLGQYVKQLESLSERRDALYKAHQKQIFQLEKKLNDELKGVYDLRSAIVRGDAEAGNNTDSKGGIPEFWTMVLMNHPEIKELITTDDLKALEYLRDVRVTYPEDYIGFGLEFIFDENPYFSQKILTKSYHLTEQEGSPFPPAYVFDYSQGTEIAWKEGMNLCHKTVIRTQRHRLSNNVRTIRRTERTPSFFHFFESSQGPNGDEDEEQEQEEIQQIDYEIGEIFKEHLVPFAFEWSTGKALLYLEGEDDEVFDEDEDFDGEGLDETEDSQDDDDDRNDGEAEEGTNRPECKQQ